MADAVNVRSFHVVINAPAEVVFDFVNDLRNLPRWAYRWCKGIRLVDDGGIVTSPGGEVYFGITADRDGGVLDWWSGPTMESAERWPTRVTGLPDGRSLYQVTAILVGRAFPPNIDEHFADELGMLKRLVEGPTVSPSADLDDVWVAAALD
jgi:uncharacterized membrane protein